MPDLGSLTSVYDRLVLEPQMLMAEVWFIYDLFVANVSSSVFFLKGDFGFRARELFYYLKGGQVDYGEEHSKVCGHSQLGRIYEQGWWI